MRRPPAAPEEKARGPGTAAVTERVGDYGRPGPWLPPPPTAPMMRGNGSHGGERARPRAEEVAAAAAVAAASPAPPLLTPPPPVRAASRRGTILGRIEGWWDLGLLDKRQTLFGGGGGRLPGAR